MKKRLNKEPTILTVNLTEQYEKHQRKKSQGLMNSKNSISP